MTIWQRAPEALWRVVPGYLLVGRSDGEIIEVSGLGPEIWELVAEPIGDEQLVAAISENLGADRTSVAAAIAPLLAEFRSRGLLVARD